VAGAFAEGAFVEGAAGAFSAGEGAGAGSVVCDRAVPARPQIMSEAIPEAKIRLINTGLATGIVLIPNKATNGFVTIARIRKRLPPICGGLIASSSQGIGHERNDQSFRKRSSQCQERGGARGWKATRTDAIRSNSAAAVT
jgi:hypothetical protein